MALFTAVSHATETTKDQLDTIRKRQQYILQHSPPPFEASKTTTEQQMNWIINPQAKPIKIDWIALASTLKITLDELNQYWNNGSIFVFDGIDSICDHYRESGIDTPAADLLKEEIKEGSVVYTQHLFFMWA